MEAFVIKLMMPPLNWQHNRAHPLSRRSMTHADDLDRRVSGIGRCSTWPVSVTSMGTTVVSEAALKTIARWAADGKCFVSVTLYDRSTRCVSDWEEGDIVATQGDAHIHVDGHGSVKDAVPDDPVPPQESTA